MAIRNLGASVTASIQNIPDEVGTEISAQKPTTSNLGIGSIQDSFQDDSSRVSGQLGKVENSIKSLMSGVARIQSRENVEMDQVKQNEEEANLKQNAEKSASLLGDLWKTISGLFN